MATETLSPDAILESTGFTAGDVTFIDDDPDGSGTDWLTVGGAANTPTVVRVSFPTPSGPLTTGAGLQEFRVQLRKTSQSTNPSAQIQLYENGSLISQNTATAVSSTTRVVHSYTWDATGRNPANIECRVVGTVGGGGTSNRASLEVGAIEWNVTYNTLVAGTDTHAAATTETVIGVARTDTITDTHTVAGTDATITNSVTLSATDTHAVVGDDVGTMDIIPTDFVYSNVVTLTPLADLPDPISGTDTHQLAVTETVQSLVVTVSATDTHQIAATDDTIALAVNATITDTQQVAVTETVIDVTRTTTATDTHQIAATETVITKAASTTITDTHQVAATDTSMSIGRVQTVTDTHQVAVTDTTITIAAASSVTDTQQVTGTQTVVTLDKFLSATDAHTISATELVAAKAADSAATDTHQIASTDTFIAIANAYAAQDTHQIAVTETVITNAVTLSATDTHAVSTIETVFDSARTRTAETDYVWVSLDAFTTTATVQRSDTVTDTDSVETTETVVDLTMMLALSVDDSHAVSSTEVASTSAGRLALDTQLVQETSNIALTVTRTMTDTSILDESDAAFSLARADTVTDTNAVQETSISSTNAALNVTDVNYVVLTETAIIGTYAITADSKTIIAQDTATLDILLLAVYSADAQRVISTETGNVVSGALNQELFQADQYSVSATEQVADRTVSYRPDLRDVGVVETAYLLIMHTRADTDDLGSVEQKIAQGVRVADALQVDIAADTVNLFQAISLFDTNVLAGADTVDLDVVYQDSIVLLYMLKQQATNIGFSRIGRGW